MLRGVIYGLLQGLHNKELSSAFSFFIFHAILVNHCKQGYYERQWGLNGEFVKAPWAWWKGQWRSTRAQQW